MAAVDRRLGVDGRDLFSRISAHPRRTLCNGIGQVYYGPVVLITDALSYSATDIFAAGFQDNEVGLVLGTAATPERGEPTSGRWTICCGRRIRIPSRRSRHCRRAPR